MISSAYDYEAAKRQIQYLTEAIARHDLARIASRHEKSFRESSYHNSHEGILDAIRASWVSDLKQLQAEVNLFVSQFPEKAVANLVNTQ